MTAVMRESIFGGCPCSAGKPECDCGLVNRQTAQEVNAEFETWRLREQQDEADLDALNELGHAVVPWLCAAGTIVAIGILAYVGA